MGNVDEVGDQLECKKVHLAEAEDALAAAKGLCAEQAATAAASHERAQQAQQDVNHLQACRHVTTKSNILGKIFKLGLHVQLSIISS